MQEIVNKWKFSVFSIDTYVHMYVYFSTLFDEKQSAID